MPQARHLLNRLSNLYCGLHPEFSSAMMYQVPHATPWCCTGTSIKPIPHMKLNVLTPAPMELPPNQRNWLTFEGPITCVSSTGVIEIQTACSNYYSDIPLSYRVPYLEVCSHVTVIEVLSSTQITTSTPAAPIQYCQPLAVNDSRIKSKFTTFVVTGASLGCRNIPTIIPEDSVALDRAT
ncbi:hypothetical protein PGT21_016476 [Puccinia graminis f. sp. tritici]|uniref:Uncharacterized protein n=1 Tax=Puccinia graminis f. sp. tritici TaxID=56615 RepID=A0A5B0MN70_PUCGR|nr:hypothetical protein PGT21_016476 [Puccinia graminis f. sp. tritici]